MEIENGEIKGEELYENPFYEDESGSKLNRVDLESKTVAELAEIAKPKSSLALSTLKGKSKAFLIDIILLPKQEEKPKARATQTASESDNIIESIFTMIETFKGKPIDPKAKDLVRIGAIEKVDNARADGTLSSGIINNAFLVIGGAMVVYDVIGEENIKKGVSFVKGNFKKR